MAVTITAAELAVELRVGDSTEESALVTRRLASASALVVKHAPDAPDAIHNEATVRVAGYLFDQPTASQGDRYANVLRNSGAARLLLPWRVHRAGSTAESSDAQLAFITSSLIRLVGSQTVSVATAAAWTATTLRLPSTTLGGLSVVPPSGTPSGIELFATSLLTDVMIGSAAGEIAGGLEFAVSAAGGQLAFASRYTGNHTITLYEVG